MKRTIALLLSAALVTTGCAPATAMRQRMTTSTPQTTHAADPQLVSSFVAQLPIGSRIKVTVGKRRVLRGTLMDRDASRIVLQLRTRLPEPPVDVPIQDIAAIDLDTPSDASVGRMIVIGVATGVAATFAVFLVIAAIYSD